MRTYAFTFLPKEKINKNNKLGTEVQNATEHQWNSCKNLELDLSRLASKLSWERSVFSEVIFGEIVGNRDKIRKSY